ncbi:hypothetical protein SAMN05216410_2177 [Sanguibacter gelidistatuariae]|uniref:N-acetyltransferase domain-containing protein n=1 Tax=Sanguibacter gelidistatuariae TaxID=1814289 RepID=A0A1G6NN35_9MICO|nr:DUF4081 domain-containing GNAT family N-acetyltransferase [Sanguibacter gelidistatuariae]SDC68784.1 hypothetical protein SAMN05216410_2177 [Sanguibacter gelidistatuariae]
MKSLRLAPRRSPAVRVLDDAELPAALAVCSQDPVASVLAATRIEASMTDPTLRSSGQVWGFPATGPLEAVCWAGANLVPVVPTPAAEILDAFAHQGRLQGRRCSSIVGPADVALGLWRRLEHAWTPAREVRPDQPSLQIVGDPLVEPDPTVRHATLDDLDDLLPACVAMFEEEVGYSPITYSGRAYTERVRGLVLARHAFVARAPSAEAEIVFKAELGAVTSAVAQVQGVWVPSRHRGRGLSAPGMAAVVAAARRDVAPTVSLYANSYNARALATYRRVGFEQVGTFATILF